MQTRASKKKAEEEAAATAKPEAVATPASVLQPESNDSTKTLIFLALFVVALSAVAFVFLNFPPMREEHRAKLSLPKSIEDVKTLGDIFSSYKEDYYYTVMLGFSLVYIFLQTFSIPGSIFLSFLGGTLFGRAVAIPLVCFLAASGASGAFAMSFLVGRRLVQYFAPDKVGLFGRKLQEHRNNLAFYFLFLRVSPLLPNWFVNVASPIFSVPFHIFFIGTFFGVMPQTAIAVNAGVTLKDIQSVSDVLDVKYFLTLVVLAFGALIPTLKPVQNFFDALLSRNAKKQD